MIQKVDAEVLVTLRDILSGQSRLGCLLALVEPTKTLARLFVDEGASVIETRFLSSTGMPHGLPSHCSRETRLAQETREQGGSRYATSVVSR